MNVAIFSAHNFERANLESANNDRYCFKYIDKHLSVETAGLADGCQAISIFVSDNASVPVLKDLAKRGVRFLTLRSAGYNHVDLEEAQRSGIKVARVPGYSPYAVAEHAVTLMLALNRKLIQSQCRLRKYNFSLDGLTGFDMNGKTVGIIGTGKIGSAIAKILYGFGCKLLAYDIMPQDKLKDLYNIQYTSLDKLYAESDIISLHVPSNSKTNFLINSSSLSKMKKGVMLINTSRGKLLKTQDAIEALESGQLGYLGMDVYEEEEKLFFEDHSGDHFRDPILDRLLEFSNVIVTGHQAFLTETALKNIAATTLYNINCFEKNIPCENEL